MPRKRIFVTLFMLLILTGCAGKRDPTQGALDFRTALMEAGGCSFTADVTAQVDDRVYNFTLDCVHSGDGTAITVTAPEIIAGITAKVQAGQTQLEYDGAILEFGKLANGTVSPVAAPGLLAQCWTGAYIAFEGSDGDQERVTYLRGYNDEELAVDTWLLDGIPTYAEVSYEDVRCITAAIHNFQFLPH